MQFFSFLLNINNRVYVHLYFWATYYFYRVAFYLPTYDTSFLVQFLALPVKAFVVYINLYILLPYLLKAKKVLLYGIALTIILALGGYMQREMVRFMIYLEIYETPIEIVYQSRKYFNLIFHISFLVLLTTSLKLIKSAYLYQQEIQHQAQITLETELKFLRGQLNPHFLFNTLNNLYALILNKSDRSAEVVMTLSELMHYMLYESNQTSVDLDREIKYIENYISLERLRFGDEMNILFQKKILQNNYKIPPLLLLPLIENAFKHHQINLEENIQKSWLKIWLQIDSRSLHLRVENPSKCANAFNKECSSSGIGLENLKRRLELLYPQNHILRAEQEQDVFKSELIISNHNN